MHGGAPVGCVCLAWLGLRRYSRSPHLPLVSFATGLQLVDFSITFKGGPSAIDTTAATRKGQSYAFSVAIKNLGASHGAVAAEAVVTMMMVPVSLPVQPHHPLVQQLVTFHRTVPIAAGEVLDVSLNVSADALSIVDFGGTCCDC